MIWERNEYLKKSFCRYIAPLLENSEELSRSFAATLSPITGRLLAAGRDGDGGVLLAGVFHSPTRQDVVDQYQKHLLHIDVFFGTRLFELHLHSIGQVLQRQIAGRTEPLKIKTLPSLAAAASVVAMVSYMSPLQ